MRLNCSAVNHERIVLIMASPHVLQNVYRTYDKAVVQLENYKGKVRGFFISVVNVNKGVIYRNS